MPRGRPRKQGDPLCERKTIRFSEDESRALDLISRDDGVDVSDFIRGIVLPALSERVRERVKTTHVVPADYTSSGINAVNKVNFRLMYTHPYGMLVEYIYHAGELEMVIFGDERAGRVFSDGDPSHSVEFGGKVYEATVIKGGPGEGTITLLLDGCERFEIELHADGSPGRVHEILIDGSRVRRN